jgi:hypothetical protein
MNVNGSQRQGAMQLGIYSSTGRARRAGRLVLLVCALSVAGCGSSSYRPVAIEEVGFLDRAVVAEDRSISVRAALPTAEETRELTGLDLYSQGIQPLWIEIHNGSEESLRAALWSVDRHYFSPLEVAYMNKGAYRADAFRDLERWIYETALVRLIPAGETRAGFVYTNLDPGTKGFNLDLFSTGTDYNFTLFVDLPGFTPDYRLVDLQGIYSAEDVRDIDGDDVFALLTEQIPCCATDESATLPGRPLNVAFVGTTDAIRRSLMRGGWHETSAQGREALIGEQDYYRGRRADGRFILRRDDSDTELVLSIWLAPWRVGGDPLWVAQAYYREIDQPLVAALRNSGALDRSALLSRFAGEAISADIDSAQRFAVQNLWYNQSLTRVAFVQMMEPLTEDAPGGTHHGYGYITRGGRALVYLSEEPAAFGDAELIRIDAPPEDATGVGEAR